MAPTAAALKIRSVRAGVVDIGSNTVRLLVGTAADQGVRTISSRRAYVGLAAEIERCGAISDEKLAEVAGLAERYAAIAFEHAVETLEVIVTAPGRHSANSTELHDALAAATGVSVRQLSAEEEGRLAYAGAVGACKSVPETIAVVDVGGGSTQLMVGTEYEPAWLRSLDLGSLRLTERFLGSNPFLMPELKALDDAVASAFDGLAPPLPLGALATGGTARTLRRIAGRRLDEENLAGALEVFAGKTAAELAAEHGIPVERARVLPAGTVILREIHRRLAVKLQVAKGGLREGAMRGLLADPAEAAA
jgi:exopolyphosphatase / guanosine-5'-triphosphate,3'-diphosphate pyrophosphatase